MTESEINRDPWVLANRISVLEHRLSAMTAERDHAVLRMEAAVATSHAWVDAEVRRRIAEAEQLGGEIVPDAPTWDDVLASVALSQASSAPLPEQALRQQRQAIGLLSTADAGRVRLGGYAPSLPPR